MDRTPSIRAKVQNKVYKKYKIFVVDTLQIVVAQYMIVATKRGIQKTIFRSLSTMIGRRELHTKNP